MNEMRREAGLITEEGDLNNRANYEQSSEVQRGFEKDLKFNAEGLKAELTTGFLDYAGSMSESELANNIDRARTMLKNQPGSAEQKMAVIQELLINSGKGTSQQINRTKLLEALKTDLVN